ncbi:MAG: hypothetical protein ACYC6O_01680 [Thermoleophilia bacterium]
MKSAMKQKATLNPVTMPLYSAQAIQLLLAIPKKYDFLQLKIILWDDFLTMVIH